MAKPSVRGYQKQNLSVLLKGMQMHVKGVIAPQLIAVLTAKAQQVVSYIDANFKADSMDFPVYSANLHDATGVAVYADGVIHRFIPTKQATELQRSGFDGVNHRGIDGNAFLQQAISEASTRFAKGIWFVIFSTVPYAYHINDSGSTKLTYRAFEAGSEIGFERNYISRGKGFFDKIVSLSVDEILRGLRAIPDASVTATPTML